MKALRFVKTGDLKYLEHADCPMPRPADGEVLVEIRAARLNRNDISNVLGKLSYTTLPRTPGRDFAGVVLEGPAQLVGKAVWGTGKELGFTRDGSHAQYLSLPADAVSLKPQALSFAQAASCGVPYVTAWHALEGTAVKSASRLLVIGAAGAVGEAAIELARWRGANIVAAVRHEKQALALEAEGVASILLPADRAAKDTLAGLVEEKFPDGADVIFDTTGFWLPESVAALADYGRIAVIVTPASGEVTVPIRDLYRRGGAIVGVNSLLYSVVQCAALMDDLATGFDSGALRGPRDLHEHALATGALLYEALSKGLAGKQVFVNEHKGVE